ncbi:hypothetical protein KOI35_32285 [Actinoplanes bogorensis]|uniref:Uncharacterized protein n=1 Tax=Paractinoplanes bogorensis TaxID=1610840 RepID=A0ABS5YXP4_9ACTN|nr:hypothetical protein [Actinoplanes bogorensis]MBU2668201.1 hypothetical protein [Actinoplanes bogorensis]
MILAVVLALGAPVPAHLDLPDPAQRTVEVQVIEHDPAAEATRMAAAAGLGAAASAAVLLSSRRLRRLTLTL